MDCLFENEECEFCGNIKDYVYSTPFGVYCKDCLQLIKDETIKGIKEIKKQER